MTSSESLFGPLAYELDGLGDGPLIRLVTYQILNVVTEARNVRCYVVAVPDDKVETLDITLVLSITALPLKGSVGLAAVSGASMTMS